MEGESLKRDTQSFLQGCHSNKQTFLRDFLNSLQNDGYMLNQENYLFCFANFLLGRDIYGPGKHIFGVFSNKEMTEKYQIIYNEEDE